MSDDDKAAAVPPAEEDIPEEWKKRNAEVRAQQAAEEAEKKRERAIELEKLKLTVGIPPKFMAIVNGGPVQETEAMGVVRAGGFDILVLSGDVGRGKTVAACWWLLQGIAEKPKPMFVTAAMLSRWERYDRGEMDKLLNAARLVVDDLGNEYMDNKGNFLAVLDELVAFRVSNGKPTIMTTNLTGEVFMGVAGDPLHPPRYGERIRDRIKESGRFMTFAGRSLRGAKQLGLLPGAAGVHQ